MANFTDSITKATIDLATLTDRDLAELQTMAEREIHRRSVPARSCPVDPASYGRRASLTPPSHPIPSNPIPSEEGTHSAAKSRKRRGTRSSNARIRRRTRRPEDRNRGGLTWQTQQRY